ncbi:MAG: hypothetical protein LC808_13185 [Actinobacteria bacterium]|nr:hypothetical protein [Actinomycetota bacterium]
MTEQAARPSEPEPEGELAPSPRDLLGNLDRFAAQIRPVEESRLLETLQQPGFRELLESADALAAAAAERGYTVEDEPVPISIIDLINRLLGRGQVHQVSLRLSNLQANLIAASLPLDHRDGSRAYLDLALRTDEGQEGQSFATLTLTNVWSDDPEVVGRFADQGQRSNNESRFFVDVGQVVPTLGPGVIWYRYWWYDSHHHHWWWYGPYWWWWRHSRWFGRRWWWWWNWWWPTWHWYHWYGWSTWWGDLNRRS